MCKSSDRKFQPEDTLTGFTITAPTLAAFLWWFSWTTTPRVKPPRGVFTNAYWIRCGRSQLSPCCEHDRQLHTLYVVKLSLSDDPRVSIWATIPLFGRQMFINFRAHVALSTPAGIITMNRAGQIILLPYGKQIRERSKFARHSSQVYNENRVNKNLSQSIDLADGIAA